MSAVYRPFLGRGALASLFLPLLCAIPVSAQGPDLLEGREPQSSFWGTGALGVGTGGDQAALGLLGRLAWERGPHRVGLRAAAAVEILSDGVADYALIYSRVARSGRSWLSAGIGPALVDTADCPGFLSSGDCTSDLVWGLALEGEVGHALARFLGLGLTVFADLNGDRSFAGGVVSLHVGRVR